jgi:hypothetical protein
MCPQHLLMSWHLLVPDVAGVLQWTQYMFTAFCHVQWLLFMSLRASQLVSMVLLH